jgi:capsular polysaccharide biosynthesis protein
VLSELWRRTRHYWYVMVIGTMISLVAAGVVLFMLPPSYEATRSLLFVPSPTSENPREPVNPFFSYLNESLATSISVISIILNDERVEEQVAPEGSGIDYSAGQTLDSTAPVLEISATGSSEVAADAASDQLAEIAARTLADQQRNAGAPRRTWIKTSLISSTIEPERVWSKPARFAAIVFGLGMLITFATTSLLWQRRSRSSPVSPSTDVAGEPESSQP